VGDDNHRDLATDARYYQEIQEAFVARRGSPLTLSSADWTLARKWRRAGVPLRIVLRGIADAMEGHAESWQRERKVYHLKFCTKAVSAAHRRWHEALSLGGRPGGGLSEHLARLAAALESAGGLPPRVSRERDRVLAAMRERVAEAGQTAALDRWLQGTERDLTRAIRAELDPSTLGAIESEIDAGLDAYRDRMPAQVVDDVRDEALTRALLARYQLPRLSLFHVE
jgi:hypothetical protein